MSKPTPIVLNSAEWETSNIRYMQPKVNDRGGKSISIISTQTNRGLSISTPLMMTWGISDFIDDKGESDGKFSMSLNFPNEDYKTDGTDAFLSKLKDFENQILDDAVKYSDAWFNEGEGLSREVVKHNFFPFLKYSKDKLTKKIDTSKSPSIRAKVPCYNGKWNLEIYDTQQNRIFPSDNENLTPMDFVPKLSNVACVLQCGGLWFGGKGWGLTWRVIQVVVKPREVVSVFGKCHISLSLEDQAALETSSNAEATEDNYMEPTKKETTTVEVIDSDDDDEEEEEEIATPAEEVKEEPAPKKKVVKKAPAPAPAAVDEPVPTPKKKVVKKKVVA